MGPALHIQLSNPGDRAIGAVPQGPAEVAALLAVAGPILDVPAYNKEAMGCLPCGRRPMALHLK